MVGMHKSFSLVERRPKGLMDIRTLQMNMKYVTSASSVIILNKVYTFIPRRETRTNLKVFQVSVQFA